MQDADGTRLEAFIKQVEINFSPSLLWESHIIPLFWVCFPLIFVWCLTDFWNFLSSPNHVV